MAASPLNQYYLAEARYHNALAAIKEAELTTSQRSAELSAQVSEELSLQKLASDFPRFYFPWIDGISEDTADAWLGHLRVAHRLRPEADWTIELCSPGGEIVAGLRIFDELLSFRASHNIQIKVRGEACSMAGVILQAATPGQRVVGPSATVMIHSGGMGMAGATHEVEDRVEYMKQQLTIIAELFEAANTAGKDAAYFQDLFKQRKDLYYRASEAVALGIADQVA